MLEDDMHPDDDRITLLLREHDAMEARRWLKYAGPFYGVIHELTRGESIDVVEEAYRQGAANVEGLRLEKGRDCSVDMILITLPKKSAYREMLFDLEDIVARSVGFEGCTDEGQKYLLLRWT